ncbi:hypothetical protein HDV05_005205 [Chytridiales sp. JEL 0842]|nr:hypothetical protein HDV05_005205 [Chytridiales sp. JEL 0842]
MEAVAFTSGMVMGAFLAAALAIQFVISEPSKIYLKFGLGSFRIIATIVLMLLNLGALVSFSLFLSWWSTYQFKASCLTALLPIAFLGFSNYISTNKIHDMAIIRLLRAPMSLIDSTPRDS